MSSGSPIFENNIPGMPSSGGSSPSSGAVSAGSFGGTNQYMNYPSMGGYGYGVSLGSPIYENSLPGMTSQPSSGSGGYVPPTSTYGGGYSGQVPPGVVPPSGSPYPSPGQLPYNANLTGTAGAVGSSTTLPGNYYGVPTVDPLFTQGYAGYLSGQLGTGISPYNLSAYLPSTGGSTGAGQVSAPLTPELQQLMQFFETGQGTGAGMSSLSQLASTGDPINQTPAWQAMVASENQNTAEQANNLKEQFGAMGDINSTSSGQALGDYYSQVALGQNSQLTQAQTAAQQQAVQNQMGASEFLNTGSQQMGQYLQGLDQQSIQNLMQEYFMTTPQENPLLAEEAQFAGTYAPVYGSKGFGAGLEESLSSSLGTSLGSISAMYDSGSNSGSIGLGG
jgi:hypothetical protein